MELDYYRNFITVVETGNITVAAKKLHMAQSALSSQLKLLETNYNTPLIIAKRGIRKITVTDAGKVLYKKAIYLCNLTDITKDEVLAAAQGNTGTLRMSLSPSSSSPMISKYLAEFSLQNPNLKFRLYEVPISQQTQQLLTGFTELGVANAPLHNAEEFEIVFGIKEHLVAIYQNSGKFLSPMLNTVSLNDLNKIPVCLSRGCSVLFKTVCSQEQFSPNILSITTTKMAAIAWASKGAGVAIIPFNLIDNLDKSLICRPLNDRRLVVGNSMVRVKNRPLSPVAIRFLNFLKNEKGIELTY